MRDQFHGVGRRWGKQQLSWWCD